MNQEFVAQEYSFEPLPEIPEYETPFPARQKLGIISLRDQVELIQSPPEYFSPQEIEQYPETDFNKEILQSNSPNSSLSSKENIIELSYDTLENYLNTNELYSNDEYKQQSKNNYQSYSKFEVNQESTSKLIQKIGSFTLDIVTRGTNTLAKEREKIAHKFRSAKMRFGGLGSITRKLQDQPDVKRGVSAVVRRAKLLLSGTQEKDEMHRAYTPLIVGLLSEPDTREQFLHGLDTAANEQSSSLKIEAVNEGELTTDVLIIGSGVHSAIFASELRSQRPNARIVAIDANQKLGGQFRSYGDRPVFAINSRNNRPQDNSTPGLPGADGNLNSFGKKATLQLPDLSSETYPNNVEMGTTAAVNQYLTTDTMSGVEFVSVTERSKDTLVTVRDIESGEIYKIATQFVINSSGAGERQPSPDVEGQYLAEDIFKHFGDKENLFPMDLFTGKNVIIKGGGDTGRVIAELLTGLGPKEAYGKSSTQFGGPQSIRWFGTDFEDRDGFCESNRPRYQRLASFIPINRFGSSEGEIACFAERIRVEPYSNGKTKIISEKTGARYDDADIVIDATNLSASLMSTIEAQLGKQAQDVVGVIEGIRNLVVAGKQIGNSVYCVGPAAKLPLSQEEKATFADGITENTVAIWANQTRTVNIAGQIAVRLGF